MKRKLALGLCIGMLGLSLVGCSSLNESDKESQVFTGDRSVELPYDEEGKDTIIATITFKENKPVDVNIDVKMEDGTMKKELSASGGYEMPGEIARWDEQIETLETFIVENEFDLSKITLVDEDGTTDAVSGVSIKVGSYIEGVQKALDEVK